jgi:hypothetical protein
MLSVRWDDHSLSAVVIKNLRPIPEHVCGDPTAIHRLVVTTVGLTQLEYLFASQVGKGKDVYELHESIQKGKYC